MNLNVKLYGMLSRSFDDYDHSKGFDVVMSKGASIHDLLIHLDLQNESVGMISMNDKPIKKESRMKDNARIKVFQPIFGG